MHSATFFAFFATACGLAVAVPAPMPSPTGIPSESTARTELAALTVAASGSLDGYDRDLFPHWISQGNSCDTRDAVLKRDGKSVVVGDSCDIESGSWLSPYDGETWTDPSDVDIDHMVPLANAWVVSFPFSVLSD
jgi:hypothetical protein